jgi:hypothetical protein
MMIIAATMRAMLILVAKVCLTIHVTLFPHNNNPATNNQSKSCAFHVSRRNYLPFNDLSNIVMFEDPRQFGAFNDPRPVGGAFCSNVDHGSGDDARTDDAKAGDYSGNKSRDTLPEHSQSATSSFNIGSAQNNSLGRLSILPAEAASRKREVATRLERVQFGPNVTTDEKALKFVDSVLTMRNEFSQLEGSQVELINADDLFYMTMRTLSLQLAFHVDRKPTTVDLGYHYTMKENLATIWSVGLMNIQERAAHGLSAERNNGDKYGQGIYTATNPCAWHGRYGDVGLIVARLRGADADFDPKCANHTHDSVTVHRNDCRECVVLATSEQCIPIVQFDANQISRNSHIHPGNMLVNRYHIALQSVVDEVFNCKDIPKP